MNRILKNHLKKFVTENGLDFLNESDQFERFVNYSVLANAVVSTIDLDEITTDSGEDGIDGIAIIVNEKIIISVEEAVQIFSQQNRNNDVEIVFIQAKTSEKFDLGDFLKYKEAILRLVKAWSEDSDYNSNSEIQNTAFSIFNQAISDVAKIRNGIPDISIYYATTGEYQYPTEIENAKEKFLEELKEYKLFKNINIQFIGNDFIIKKWVSSYSGINASLSMEGSIAFPEITGVAEAYLAVVKAREYVTNLLQNEDGTIKNQLFEENVRHYLGSDNLVYNEIKLTLNSDLKNRFPVLNNGITIVSPDVQIRGKQLHISNYQIVNGCQTSHVLFENRDMLEDITLTLKVVETTDEDVFSQLVKATNSQSHVDEKQFLSLHPLAKRIEEYFKAYNSEDDGKLYFERRKKQYIGQDVPNLRVVDFDYVIRAVCAMFLERPELSSQYPKRIYDEFHDKIFNDSIKECIFYTAALVLYRFRLLIASKNISSKVTKYKWHFLPLIAYQITKREIPKLNSKGKKGIESYCEEIIQRVSTHNSESTSIFIHIANFLEKQGDVKIENLKNRAFAERLIQENKRNIYQK